jgi:hypothetical protein
MVRASVAASLSLIVLVPVSSLLPRSPAVAGVLGVIGVVVGVACLVWGLWPIREVPSNARLARFIEERVPALDDRLVSAVHVGGDWVGERPELADALLVDASRAVASIDADSVVPTARLRRSALEASAALILLAITLYSARNKAVESFDALAFALFPSMIQLEVKPGDARVPHGSTVRIEARLAGNRAPVTTRLLRTDGSAGEAWRTEDLTTEGAGRFALAIESVETTFQYRVVAGAISSPTYTITAVKPPRVKRIDVEYTYPKGLGLASRLEEDGGDIYAPAGTAVRVLVSSDRPAATGSLLLGAGSPVHLAPGPDGRLVGLLAVEGDNSYRISLADGDGLASRGDTEYFIRRMEDRPPEVHISKPARDRRVTRLEEVDIEVEAHDDFGVERLDLVYAVRGGNERVIPLDVPRNTSVTGRRTLYLEDLSVEPGDFVAYYARARDLPRGKRSSEGRSDIFFLEVKPFEEEFTLIDSQAQSGAAGRNHQIDDLVAAQKEIIVSTWKLDRRAQSAGAKSEQDIKAVAAAQSELKTRVQEVASAFRTSTMRDPRRRSPQGGRGGGPSSLPGTLIPEEDAMTAAASAMGKAATSLSGLRTGEALPFEMEALNHLLRAQAEVKKRQVQRQQAGRGAGGNRSDVDVSALFDRELARQQQTNYETPSNMERTAPDASALDDIKELARRQDELLQRQRDVGRDKRSGEELKRELEKLTREQNELRQRAEELAQRLTERQSRDADSRDGQSSRERQSSKDGQANKQGQASGQAGSPGRSGESGQAEQGSQRGSTARGAKNAREMKEISDEMRNAAGDLRRQDAARASQRSARALERLRELERDFQARSPDGRRRALGDLQLEARQLADGQRQIASEAERAGSGEAGRDTLRRLAGEEERLAERARRIQEGLKEQTGSAIPGDNAAAAGLQRAAADAAREVEHQRLVERMQQSASAMRGQSDRGAPDGAGDERRRRGGVAEAEREIARAFDRLADRLASAGGSADSEARKLSEQIGQTRELRERLDQLTRQLDDLAQTDGRSGGRGSAGQRDNAQTSSAAGARQGSAASGTPESDAARLGESITREIGRVRELLEQIHREETGRVRQGGGAGSTFEAPGNMVLSAPGTEAFKQDFAKWQELRKQATGALEVAETTLAKRLLEKQSKDRLAAGLDDKAPADYQQQVDSYFKALAGKKK